MTIYNRTFYSVLIMLYTKATFVPDQEKNYIVNKLITCKNLQ